MTRYCKLILQDEDWKGCFSRITFNMVYHFLKWHLAQQTGNDGRKKRQIQAQDSLRTFWCNFRLVFEREMHMKIDKVIDCRMVANVRSLACTTLPFPSSTSRPVTPFLHHWIASTDLSSLTFHFETSVLSVLTFTGSRRTDLITEPQQACEPLHDDPGSKATHWDHVEYHTESIQTWRVADLSCIVPPLACSSGLPPECHSSPTIQGYRDSLTTGARQSPGPAQVDSQAQYRVYEEIPQDESNVCLTTLSS